MDFFMGGEFAVNKYRVVELLAKVKIGLL